MAKAKKKTSTPKTNGPSANKSHFNAKWFTDQLKKLEGGKGISQREAARRLGLNQATISLMFKGKRLMPMSEAPKWAELLNCGMEDVMNNAGVDVPEGAPAVKGSMTKLPVEGWADGDLVVHWGAVGLKGSKTVANPGSRSGHTKCIRCQTSGSKFQGMDGTLVYYDHYEGIAPESVGRWCVVKIRGSDASMIRVPNRGYESGKHNLQLPTGETSEENVIIESASPILWMKL